MSNLTSFLPFVYPKLFWLAALPITFGFLIWLIYSAKRKGELNSSEALRFIALGLVRLFLIQLLVWAAFYLILVILILTSYSSDTGTFIFIYMLPNLSSAISVTLTYLYARKKISRLSALNHPIPPL